MSGKWPKTFPPLTGEQQRIRDDFMKLWHEVLPKKYGILDKFSHTYVVNHAPGNFLRTLEIGAGLGEHLKYEKLSKSQKGEYLALELRENMAAEIRRRFPEIKTRVGDCQRKLDFPDGFFDRIIAVHVLEHLPDLPAAVREIHRLCDRRKGVFSIVIPCEGGLAYYLARRLSAQRIFEKRYRQSYRWFIEREHLNRPGEILEELKPYFRVCHRQYFPLPVPSVSFNLCIGYSLRPREGVDKNS